MTGRELIIYILSNHLEDEKLTWFMTIEEAAVLKGCGTAGVKAMIKLGQLKAIEFGGKTYIYSPNPVSKDDLK